MSFNIEFNSGDLFFNPVLTFFSTWLSHSGIHATNPIRGAEISIMKHIGNKNQFFAFFILKLIESLPPSIYDNHI